MNNKTLISHKVLVRRNDCESPRVFAYDLCFDEEATQQQIFDELGVSILQNSIKVSIESHKLGREGKGREGKGQYYSEYLAYIVHTLINAAVLEDYIESISCCRG